MRLLLIALAFLAAPQGALAQIVISEFVANNGASLDDEDGDSSDWIEIHNQGAQLNLGGYALTDDPAIPQKWIFPGGQFLGPGSYLIVFASGKDRAALAQQLHTNFSLDSAGGYLALADPAGNILQEFSPAYPKQKRDLAYGIGNDMSIGYLDPPTPNGPNGPPLTDFVADTIFSHKRGFYTSAFSVAITSATPGASIRYTTNGTKPRANFGTSYTGPINISSTTVIRAIAYKSGMVSTNIDAQTYLFTADIVNQPRMISSIVNSATYRGEIQGSLQALPVVSLSFNNNDLFGLSGIHRNPELTGRTSEREIHFEFFNPADPADSTHEPGGVRIHGGNSRRHPKKAFRLYFRSDYGKSRLQHDVFPGSPVRSFKHLLLRGGGHDAWTFRSDWKEATLIRNEFLHRLQQAMGQPSPYGRFINLFLNGDYWGVYELQELPHEYYNADHHGGQPEDWDVVKHGEEVESGNITAWDQMINLARAGIGTDAHYAAIQEFLDVDHFADCMIHRIWSSDEDWLAPEFLNGVDISSFNDDKNWYVARKSRNGTSKFIFYCWDAEMSMGIPFSGPRSYQIDFTRVDNDHSPGIIYDALRSHPEFQLRFADRLHKHMFNNGAMTVPELRSLWDPLVSTVRSPMVAESARWGLDSWGGARTSPYSRNSQWDPAVLWVRSQFLTHRTATVLNQFRGLDLYPDVGAPNPSPVGTIFTNPVTLSLTTTTGGSTIYFTTTGADPRQGQASPSSLVELVTATHPVQAIVPDLAIDSLLGTTWRTLADPSNIAAWITGPNGVGFEGAPANLPNYLNLINTPLNDMEDINASAYIRIKFNIPDQATIDSLNQLTLRMRYDDGFFAYLNGSLIESKNAFTSNWNSTATTNHSDSTAVNFADFDQTSDIGLLVPGENILAIHGLNRTATSSDFLIQVVLDGDTGALAGTVSPGAQVYTGPLLIDQTTHLKARTRSADGTWSALTEIIYRIGTPASSSNLKITELHYHPTDPVTTAELAISTTDNDFEFLELENVTGASIDLSLCRFSNGIEFAFPLGTSLPGGARVLLVSDLDAFRARYGSTIAPAILGEFGNDTHLSNKGERLALLDAVGNFIFNFSFSDDPPWPTTPDGGGPSLVLIDPPNTPVNELGDGTRWRASLLAFGAPDLADTMSFELWTRMTYGPLDGTDPATAGPLVIPSGPGHLSNLMLYAQGQDLSNGAVSELNVIDVAIENGKQYLTLSFQIRNDLTGISSVVTEVSEDLINWSPAVEVVSQTENGDGTTTITVRDHISQSPSRQRFIRLRIKN